MSIPAWVILWGPCWKLNISYWRRIGQDLLRGFGPTCPSMLAPFLRGSRMDAGDSCWGSWRTEHMVLWYIQIQIKTVHYRHIWRLLRSHLGHPPMGSIPWFHASVETGTIGGWWIADCFKPRVQVNGVCTGLQRSLIYRDPSIGWVYMTIIPIFWVV